MKIKFIYLALSAMVTLPVHAQLFNFSFRTNNRQLIDEALSGAFIKISQSYELCDTVNNKHFGRADRDYFSIVPFVGVETERGLVLPAVVEQPWTCDVDFYEYKDKYKPIVIETTRKVLNADKATNLPLSSPVVMKKIAEGVDIVEDKIETQGGMKVDTIPGYKDGWFVWISCDDELLDVDSVRFTSIKEAINIPEDESYIKIDRPDIDETIYGGIYVMPVQTAIGQITLYLTGFIIVVEDEYRLVPPFVRMKKESEKLTPISSVISSENLNSLKKK